MKDERDAARKARKLRASRDQWKQRSAEKQKQIRQLRVAVRDLSSSREYWRKRAKDLEQQLQAMQAVQDSHSTVAAGSAIVFGGVLEVAVMPQTAQTRLCRSSD
jgi:uncharacterized protein YlxW (UPF0749 family)